ncbi:MAG: hypothetical protein ACTXOO_04875 [Sodalis sp. (in: enterobacteria)]
MGSQYFGLDPARPPQTLRLPRRQAPTFSNRLRSNKRNRLLYNNIVTKPV